MDDHLIPLDGWTLAQVQPFGARLFVRADSRIDALRDVVGIVIPQSVLDYNPETFPITGRVVAIGPRVRELRVGQRVWFERYGGKQMVIEGRFYLTFEEDEIWGVGEDPPMPPPAMDPESADVRAGRETLW